MVITTYMVQMMNLKDYNMYKHERHGPVWFRGIRYVSLFDVVKCKSWRWELSCARCAHSDLILFDIRYLCYFLIWEIVILISTYIFVKLIRTIIIEYWKIYLDHTQRVRSSFYIGKCVNRQNDLIFTRIYTNYKTS